MKTLLPSWGLFNLKKPLYVTLFDLASLTFISWVSYYFMDLKTAILYGLVFIGLRESASQYCEGRR